MLPIILFCIYLKTVKSNPLDYQYGNTSYYKDKNITIDRMPEEINSALFGCIYRGRFTFQGIYSLFLYLAEKGCIEIVELPTLQRFHTRTYEHKIVCVANGQHVGSVEKLFLDTIFADEKEILCDYRAASTIARRVEVIRKQLSKALNADELFDPNILMRRKTTHRLMGLSVVLLFLNPIITASFIKPETYEVLTLFTLVHIVLLVGMFVHFQVTGAKQSFGRQLRESVNHYVQYIGKEAKIDIKMKGCSCFYKILPFGIVSGSIHYHYLLEIKDYIDEIPSWYKPFNEKEGIRAFKKYLVSNWLSIPRPREIDEENRRYYEDYDEVLGERKDVYNRMR